MSGNLATLTRIRQEVDRLPRGIREHIGQVRAVSVDLARRFGVDGTRAELAALAHDVCRAAPGAELLRLARAFGLRVTPMEEAIPVFLHGPVGAEVLCRDYALDDEEVLNAIRCHTMGRGEMTPLDNVLFLADKLDPSKGTRYPFIAEVDRLARRDLDRALLHFIDHQTRAFIDHGDLVHPGMTVARNDALLALRDAPTGP